MQSGGPGWTSTTITFGDSSQPGVLTLHNLLGVAPAPSLTATVIGFYVRPTGNINLGGNACIAAGQA